jgi:hypothetical protein
LAAAGNPHIRLYDVNSNHPQPVCFSCELSLVYYNMLIEWNFLLE